MYSDTYKRAHEEGQKKIDWSIHSNRMRINNPMWDLETAKKSWSNRHSHKISGPEQKIINLEKHYQWGLEFTGNGSFWVERQNPDFKIVNQNKVIEIYDSSSPRYDRGPEWEEKRRAVYERNGFKVLFLDFFDKEKKNSHYTLSRKAEFASNIQTFIMNGEKVTRIQPYIGKKNRIAKIECFPHKNYFVESILSHNCDTTPVWLRGEYVEFHEIIDEWKQLGIYEKICDGTIHVIWTGGEPTIRQHQESIVNFSDQWAKYEDLSSVFYEIETNGRNYVIDDLFLYLNQINCSPKLSNSGMTEKQRIVPKSIERIMEHPNYQFKFVISNEDDIFEMFNTYIKPFNIPLKNVVCMPALTEQQNFFERTQWCMEMGKKYKFTALTRLHVASWNSLTGV